MFKVKENAAWALGYIAKHSEQLAGMVVDAGTLPLLVLAFQEPEMSLKQVGKPWPRYKFPIEIVMMMMN